MSSQFGNQENGVFLGGLNCSLRILYSFPLFLKFCADILTYPLWLFDSIEKEHLVLAIPYTLRKYLLRVLFLPTLLWTVLLNYMSPQKRRWYDRINHHVLIGALPFSGDIESLARIEGVTHVINMTEEYAGPLQAYDSQGIEQLCLPTLDYSSPTLEQLEKGVEFIRKEVYNDYVGQDDVNEDEHRNNDHINKEICKINSRPSKGTVYIHCKA
eukprot:Awhi_evm1s13119